MNGEPRLEAKTEDPPACGREFESLPEPYARWTVNYIEKEINAVQISLNMFFDIVLFQANKKKN